MRIAVPVDTNEGMKSRVSFLFGRAPYIALIDYEGEVKRVSVENNPYAQAVGGAGPSLAQYLADRGVNVILASEMGPNASSILASLGMTWVPVPANITVEEALRYLEAPQIPTPPPPPQTFRSREEEIEWLKQRKEWIERRLREIEQRLSELQ